MRRACRRETCRASGLIRRAPRPTRPPRSCPARTSRSAASTRRCTSRATSGSTSPYRTASSSSTGPPLLDRDVEPARGRRTRAPSTVSAAAATRCESTPAVTVTVPSSRVIVYPSLIVRPPPARSPQGSPCGSRRTGRSASRGSPAPPRASSARRRPRARGAPGARGRSRRAGRRPRRRASRAASRSAAGRRARPPGACRRGHPGPPGRRSRSIRPGAGAKPREGSSALIRHSIACPCRGARPSSDSGSPAATRSCSRTMSIPVTSSVTGCSTCRRAFSSMK